MEPSLRLSLKSALLLMRSTRTWRWLNCQGREVCILGSPAFGNGQHVIKCRQRLGGVAAIFWLRSARGRLRSAALGGWTACCEPGFFRQCFGAAVRNDRQIGKDQKFSVHRQCAIRTLVRSDLYYQPKGTSIETCGSRRLLISCSWKCLGTEHGTWRGT